MADERRKGPSGNTVKVKQAEADAKRAEAQAKEAEARAKAIEAESEAKRIAAETERRASEDRQRELDRSAAERKREADQRATEQKQIFDTAVTVASYVSGVAVAAATVKKLDALHAQGVAAQNKQLRKLANQVGPLLDDAASASQTARRSATKLRAITKTADRSGVTRAPKRGTAGPATGVALIASGLVSRGLAAQQDNETVKTVLNASGTAEVVAGGLVIAKDIASRSANTDRLDVAALSKIDQADAIAAQKPKKTPASKPRAKAAPKAKAGRLRGGGVTAIALGTIAAAAAVVDAVAHGASASEAASAGGKAAGDVVTGGGVTEFDAAKLAGAADAEAAARAASVGAINLATFGVATAADDVLRATTGSGVAETITELLKTGLQTGKAYLNAGAENKAASREPSPTARQATPIAGPAGGDGQTAGYTRVVRGQAVQVKAYRTPTR